MHSDCFHDHDKRLVWITLEYLQQTLKAFRTNNLAEKGLTRNNLAEKGLTRCMLGNLSFFYFRLLNSSKFLLKSMGPGWDQTRDPGTAVRHAFVVRHAALSTALRGPVYLSVNRFGSRSALTQCPNGLEMLSAHAKHPRW